MTKLLLEVGQSVVVKRIGKSAFGMNEYTGEVTGKRRADGIMLIQVSPTDRRYPQHTFAGDDNRSIGGLREWRLVG